MNVILNIAAISQSLDLDTMKARHVAVFELPWGAVEVDVPEEFVDELVTAKTQGLDVLDLRSETPVVRPQPTRIVPPASEPKRQVPRLSDEQRARAGELLGIPPREVGHYSDEELVEAIELLAKHETERRSRGIPDPDVPEDAEFPEEDEYEEREFSTTAPGGTFSLGDLLANTPAGGEEEEPPLRNTDVTPTPEQAAQARAAKKPNPAKARVETLKAKARSAPRRHTVEADERGYPVVEQKPKTQSKAPSTGADDDLFPQG